MTLEELYALIGADYDAATKVMRKDRLIDKYVRKFPNNELRDALMAAGENMDATGLYESAHGLKGVCANLGFTELAGLASDVCEEYRPGNERTCTDDEVKAKLAAIDELFDRTVDGIRQYENEQG